MSADTAYTIGELAQAASVTTRTIRYYVAQGLLPPPHSSGPAASYGDAHLYRLELIKLLKEEFLPLNEIKALLDGLDDDDVRGLLAERRQESPTPTPETAKEYLQALLNPPAKSPPLLRQIVVEKAQRLSSPSPLGQTPSVKAGSGLRAKHEPVSPVKESELSGEAASVWQRYPVHPDVELHVRQPPSDARLGSRLDQLITDIRRLIAKRDLQ